MIELAFRIVLPCFNAMLAAHEKRWGTGRGGNRQNGYNQLKSELQAQLVLQANGQLQRHRARLLQVHGPYAVSFTWFEKTRRRDPDDIAAGTKFALDALGPGRKGSRGWEGAKLLHCDGWHCIAEISHRFVCNGRDEGFAVRLSPITREEPSCHDHDCP